MRPSRIAIAALTIGLAGCTVGPDYKAPSARLATSFAEGTAAPVGDVTAQYWWLRYNDALLNQLVQTGLKQNLDIRTALARVEAAQATARGTGVPDLISGNVVYNNTRSGADNVDSTTQESTSFEPALVLDLFGGSRRTREQALANLQSAELSVGVARLAFLSALVSNYIDMRYFQSALAITRETIGNRQETFNLVQSQLRAGTATALDEAQAQATLDQARGNLPALEAGYYAAAYAIATLLDQPVQNLLPQLQRGAAQPRPHGGSSVGVPADLLRNRPDIRAAERDYAAAIARVGVTEAALYPAISLNGTITATDTTSWSFGPRISVPVLGQPGLRATRDAAVANAEATRLVLRSTILDAVEDVQAAQTRYLRNTRSVGAQNQTVTSYTRVVQLSRDTYDAGSTTLLDLLDNQVSLANARLSLAGAVRDMATSWATLQVAAGMGWEIPAQPEAVETASR